jgi:hypothetical protein
LLPTFWSTLDASQLPIQIYSHHAYPKHSCDNGKSDAARQKELTLGTAANALLRHQAYLPKSLLIPRFSHVNLAVTAPSTRPSDLAPTFSNSRSSVRGNATYAMGRRKIHVYRIPTAYSLNHAARSIASDTVTRPGKSEWQQREQLAMCCGVPCSTVSRSQPRALLHHRELEQQQQQQQQSRAFLLFPHKLPRPRSLTTSHSPRLLSKVPRQVPHPHSRLHSLRSGGQCHASSQS